jgi:GT2 family glycosyltransferase
LLKSSSGNADVTKVESVPTLIIVPARAESQEAIEPLLQTLVSVRSTAPEAMVLVVDDRSPGPLAHLIEAAASELDCAYVLQQDGEGRQAALNIGISAALQHGMDVCLVAQGLVFEGGGWLGRMLARTGTDGAPAAIVGGIVLQPTGVVRQAGYYFSLFRRTWGARLRQVPEVVLEHATPLLCPVSSELQLIRNEWLQRVSFYDEQLKEPHASLDYVLRVHREGGESVLEPSVRARALEVVDGEPDDTTESAHRLRVKHSGVSFQRWAPEVI